tara:strand:- start:157 stop:1275 length:1119 start_codon:yes stop_codon:yes gene_type:complete
MSPSSKFQFGKDPADLVCRVFRLLCTVLALALVAGCASTLTGKFAKYRIENLSRGPAANPPPVVEAEVSVQALIDTVRRLPALAANRRSIGLNTVNGYRWDGRDLFLIGTRGGPSRPVTMRLFVEALRLGHYPNIYMSLNPDPKDSRHHRVVSGPNDIMEDSELLERLTMADYLLKSLGAGIPEANVPDNDEGRKKRIEDCKETEQDRGRSPENIYFTASDTPDDVRFSGRDIPGGHQVEISKLKITLKPGDQVTHPDPIAYAKAFTENFEMVKRLFPVFHDMENAFRLFAVMQQLRFAIRDNRKLRDQVRYLFVEYPLVTVDVPDALPVMPEERVGAICVINWKEEYQGFRSSGGIRLGGIVKKSRYVDSY